MISNPGVKVAALYGAAYLLVLTAIWLVDLLALPIDISFWVSIFTSFALITWLTENASYQSKASILLLVSLIASTTLIMIQYVLFLKYSSLVYNPTNAIIGPTLTILTVLDILAMIWITLDGIRDKPQRFFNEPDTVRGYMRDVVESCKTHKGGDKKA